MSEAYVIRSQSVEHTLQIGMRLGVCAKARDVIALMGCLGAGKTQLVKGLATGLAVVDTRIVNSPTYVLVNEYEGRLPIYHVDVYRLAGAPELTALGFEEMCEAGGLVVVEWADKVQALLPPDHLSVLISVIDESTRSLEFCAGGKASQKLLSDLRSENGQM